jgi:hypothetical protein
MLTARWPHPKLSTAIHRTLEPLTAQLRNIHRAISDSGTHFFGLQYPAFAVIHRTLGPPLK